VLKANQSTTYTKTEVDSNLAFKHKLLFPSNEGSNGWGVIADSTNTARRIVGAQPIRTFIEFDLNNPSSINEVQIGLDMDLTGLTKCYNKTGNGNNLLLAADGSITHTKSEVGNRIANLVDSAPAMLNALKELATALNNDQNFPTSVTNLIGTNANQVTTYTKIAIDQVKQQHILKQKLIIA
jgi:hypothetical protein